jgi:hypothetical protein
MSTIAINLETDAVVLPPPMLSAEIGLSASHWRRRLGAWRKHDVSIAPFARIDSLVRAAPLPCGKRHGTRFNRL